MGIGDRDYMRRRPPDDDEPHGGASGNASKLAGFLNGFLDRYPRFGLWFAVVLGVLILAVLIMARLSVR